jgi:predicted ribosomally synthesized peptide with nif11-like leader
MSSEIERLVGDIQNHARLQEEAKGLGTDPKALVEWANGKGYEFSLDELNAYAEAQLAELSEEELEQVAGGVAIARSPVAARGRAYIGALPTAAPAAFPQAIGFIFKW